MTACHVEAHPHGFQDEQDSDTIEVSMSESTTIKPCATTALPSRSKRASSVGVCVWVARKSSGCSTNSIPCLLGSRHN